MSLFLRFKAATWRLPEICPYIYFSERQISLKTVELRKMKTCSENMKRYTNYLRNIGYMLQPITSHPASLLRGE